MILGSGVDIVEIKRISKALERYGDRFLERLLTEAEQEQWRLRGGRLDTLAGYWTAKEAVAKALGSGFRGFGPREIHISYDLWGRPLVALTERAAARAAVVGIHHIWLSISHSLEYAVATAIAEGRTS